MSSSNRAFHLYKDSFGETPTLPRKGQTGLANRQRLEAEKGSANTHTGALRPGEGYANVAKKGLGRRSSIRSFGQAHQLTGLCRQEPHLWPQIGFLIRGRLLKPGKVLGMRQSFLCRVGPANR